jgi:hypothetical protein
MNVDRDHFCIALRVGEGVGHDGVVADNVEAGNASGSENGQVSLKVRLLELRRRVDRRPCVRMRGGLKPGLHIRVLLFLCSGRL